MFSKILNPLRLAISAITIVFASTNVSAYEISGKAALSATVGSNDFAPYYFTANNFGILTQSKDILFNVGAFHPVDSTKRFSHSWGAEFYAGASSAAPYQYWDAAANPPALTDRNVRPASFWIQQLWGEIKYRRIFVQAGMKPHASKILDNKLTGGDLVWSGNARPVPEVRAGFIDFVDIPLTKHWVQIEGVISYDWFTDNRWCEDHYNYYSQLIATGLKMCYKRISFRTNPEKPFFVIASAQNASTFGGTTKYYYRGTLSREVHNGNRFVDYLEALVPFPHGGAKDDYYPGDNKGSWDLRANYRFKNNDVLSAYFQWLWEDSSGMAKKNGWDGLWGIQYSRGEKGWFNSALIEYLDLTNMSGPFMWNAPDTPGTTLEGNLAGGDNYYNNTFYRGYTNYGMTIGTPMVMGTVFQLNGSQLLCLNRVRGIHIAATGNIGANIEWLVKVGYRKAWGVPGTVYILHPHHATSFMAEATWTPEKNRGFSFKAQIGFDKGNMPQNTFGGMLSVVFDRTFFKH